MDYGAIHMPPRAPLEMPAQTFAAHGPPRAMLTAPKLRDLAWRLSAFIPTIALTVTLCVLIFNFFASGGITVIEAVVSGLLALTFLNLAFSVNNACLGAIRVAMRPVPPSSPNLMSLPRNVALLIPIFNEAPCDVFGNAAAMLKDLDDKTGLDKFTLFVLSDTQDPAIAAQEEQALAILRASFSSKDIVFYRRRIRNTDKKVGNITDWIENWGGAYDAMVVLDADSLMSGAAIRQLTQALADDPDAGLIQSRPVLIGAQTLFSRVNQFSNFVYGGVIAEGLNAWSQDEGNYWGHNAIIRTRAFAQSARLPHLRNAVGAKRLVLSHDFVEAGMLRRAGWSVRFLPRLDGSFEETPQTLIDYTLRDRRWCLGNMQHLLLLAARGFHVISRFHLLQGALAFLMCPAWLAVLVFWSFLGLSPVAPKAYFSPDAPLAPVWPEQEMSAALVYLLFVYGMLVFPKILGAIIFSLRADTRAAYRSRTTFLGSVLFEFFLSVLYAPITMVQTTIATVYAVLGKSAAWSPQNRGSGGYTWKQTFRFHWVETVCGLIVCMAVFYGHASVLILPLAISLLGAVPLSRLSAMHVEKLSLRALRMDTPHTLIEPIIVSRARAERAWIKSAVMATAQAEGIAAE